MKVRTRIAMVRRINIPGPFVADCCGDGEVVDSSPGER